MSQRRQRTDRSQEALTWDTNNDVSGLQQTSGDTGIVRVSGTAATGIKVDGTIYDISGGGTIHPENATMTLSRNSAIVDPNESVTVTVTLMVSDDYVITDATLSNSSGFSNIVGPTRVSDTEWSGTAEVDIGSADVHRLNGTINATLNGATQSPAPVTATFTVAPEPAQWYARASFLPPTTIGGDSGDFVVGNSISNIQGELGRTLFLWIPTSATANFSIGSGISILDLENANVEIDNHRLYNAGALSGGNITLTVRRI